MQRAIYTLPLAPSTNRLWRPGRDAKGNPAMFATERYRVWKRDAENRIQAQRPKAGKVRGPYRLLIEASRPSATADLDNLVKATSDALANMDIVENDRLADGVELEWVTGLPERTMRVTITASNGVRAVEPAARAA